MVAVMLAPSTTDSILGQRALAYAARGLWVFPCLPRAKEPATANGFKDATADPGLITHWWRQNPHYNIGFVTGRLSHCFVLDIDGDEAELELKKLETEHDALPSTVESITARGRHLFFDWPSQTIRNSAGKVAPGIDIRGEGGYVLAPPSIHPSGRAYCWSVDSGDTFAPAPAWLLSKLGANGHRIGTPPAEWRALVRDGVVEGGRNTALTRLAGLLLRQRVDALVALELLTAWNQTRCQPPLEDSEVTTIVDSIARAELKRRGARTTNGGVT
jgi:hypothetical protein